MFSTPSDEFRTPSDKMFKVLAESVKSLFRTSISVSVPPASRNVSWPSLPVTVSLSDPESMVSAKRLPTIQSSPAPPLSVRLSTARAVRTWNSSIAVELGSIPAISRSLPPKASTINRSGAIEFGASVRSMPRRVTRTDAVPGCPAASSRRCVTCTV